MTTTTRSNGRSRFDYGALGAGARSLLLDHAESIKGWSKKKGSSKNLPIGRALHAARQILGARAFHRWAVAEFGWRLATTRSFILAARGDERVRHPDRFERLALFYLSGSYTPQAAIKRAETEAAQGKKPLTGARARAIIESEGGGEPLIRLICEFRGLSRILSTAPADVIVEQFLQHELAERVRALADRLYAIADHRPASRRPQTFIAAAG
jgi:hypothetical protein